jgi:hypothetical protein
MKIHLPNNETVCHYWANKVQSEGKGPTIFFRDSMIFSYGEHFCMARHTPSGKVAITNRHYSITTSGHMSRMRQACRHLESYLVDEPDATAHANLAAARRAIGLLLEKAKKPRLQEKTRIQLRGEALEIAQGANQFLIDFPCDYATAIDTANLEQIAVELARVKAEEAERKAERERANIQIMALKLQDWRDGDDSVAGLYSVPVALRIVRGKGRHTGGLLREGNDDMIETSHGAEIPTNHAIRLWPVIQRVKNSGQPWRPTEHRAIKVGVYNLDHIKADGSIKVGCHDIPYDEIKRMADLLGLTEEVTA